MSDKAERMKRLRDKSIKLIDREAVDRSSCTAASTSFTAAVVSNPFTAAATSTSFTAAVV